MNILLLYLLQIPEHCTYLPIIFYNKLNFKFCFKIPAIVAVAIAALIATARVADVPAARSTAITVHVPVARSDSTKMQEKKEINKLSNFYYFYYFLLMMKICFDIDFNKA